MRHRKARIATVCLVALAMSLVVAPSAVADDSAPRITSFHRVSPDVIGPLQQAVLEFSAEDEGLAGLSYALFFYRGPNGEVFRADSPEMQRASQGTFQATELVGPWGAAGTYTLESIEVTDREANKTVYERGASGLDLTGGDFSVENPNEDVTPPMVTSARLWQATVKAGDPVVVLYGASDDRSGVREVVVSGWTPAGHQFWLQSLPELGAAGPATWLVPLAAPAGEYDVILIHVIDRAGNTLTYRPGESPDPYPEDAVVPSHTYPDPDALDFVVEGGPGDVSSPLITDFDPITPSTRRPGEQVALDFSATDEGTGVDRVGARWTDDMGHEVRAEKDCGDATGGPLTVTLDDFRSLDTDWALRELYVFDHLGNWSIYHRDGRRTDIGSFETGEPHGLDLSRGDFRIEAGEPSEPELEDTTGQWCPVIGDVSIDLDDTDVLVGEVVASSGAVRVGDLPVPGPVVAIHEHVAGEPRLLAVRRGGSDGRYRARFTPRGGGTVRASFLGSEGPRGADPSLSEGISLTVRPRIRVELDRSSIATGRTAVLSGSIKPRSGPVILQQWLPDGWADVREGAVSSTGAFSFSLRPQSPGDRRYRVIKPGAGSLAQGSSRSRTLTVHRSASR